MQAPERPTISHIFVTTAISMLDGGADHRLLPFEYNGATNNKRNLTRSRLPRSMQLPPIEQLR